MASKVELACRFRNSLLLCPLVPHDRSSCPDLINEHRLYGAFAGGGSFPGSCAAALSDSAGIAGPSIKTVLGFLAPRFIKKFAV